MGNSFVSPNTALTLAVKNEKKGETGNELLDYFLNHLDSVYK